MITNSELRTWGTTDTQERRDAWETLLLEIDARISLSQTQYAGLNSRYESISEILAEPRDQELGDLLVFPQGSISTRTVTKPPGREDVDVDAIAYVKGGAHLSPLDLLDRLYKELKDRVRTAGWVKLSNRCVTIKYADKQLPCHLDVTPAENQPGNPKCDGSGRLRVPDCRTAGWSPSNPKDFAEWFEACAALKVEIAIPSAYQALLEKRAEAEPLPAHNEIVAPNGLRVSVRLMKRHRDIYVERTGRKKTKPISVILTTLVAKAYERVVKRSWDQTLSPLQILTQVVAEMPNCFDSPTASEPHRLLNPADYSENFSEKWNENPEFVRTFSIWHSHLQRVLRYGLFNFPSRERFRSELAEAFGMSAGRVCEEFFAEITNGVYPGLSVAAARKAGVAGRSAALIGLGRSEPTRAAQPKPLDRLG